MYDILIRNATIVDGTGAPGFAGDIAVKNDRLVAVGKAQAAGAITIDAGNLVVCPGFIDVHSHPDFTMQLVPQCENYLMQGITTVVGGNCGLSLAPKENRSFGQYLQLLDAVQLSINYVPLVGHGAVRTLVLGDDSKRPATAEEIEQMKKLVQEAMQSGSFGFSTGLDYHPAEHAEASEVIALAGIASQYNGIFAIHHAHIHDHWASEDRDQVGYGAYYGEIEDAWVGIYRGLLEAIDMARQADLPLQISHLANVYRFPQPHPDDLDAAGARATLKIIDAARKEGLDISFDVICFETSIAATRPIIDEFLCARAPGMQSIREFGREEFLQQIRSTALRDRIRELSRSGKVKFSMIHTKANPFWMNCFTVISCANKHCEGKTIGEISAAQQQDPFDVVFDLMAEDPETTWFQTTDLRMRGSIPEIFLKHDCAMPVTDMAALPPIELPVEAILQMMPGDLGDRNITPDMVKSALNTPNFYGAFPEFIGSLIRDKGIFSLEEGIKKMTSLPARRFGLDKRGVLKPGNFADMVVFDFERIGAVASPRHPRQKPKGIQQVIINGQVVYENNEYRETRSGQVLRKK